MTGGRRRAIKRSDDGPESGRNTFLDGLRVISLFLEILLGLVEQADRNEQNRSAEHQIGEEPELSRAFEGLTSTDTHSVREFRNSGVVGLGRWIDPKNGIALLEAVVQPGLLVQG